MSAATPGMAPEKAALRRLARRRRDALPAAQRSAASRRITAKCLAEPVLQGARSVFIYVSTEFEVDTRALIETCHARGLTVLVPAIVERRMLAVAFPGWSSMRPAALGILQPAVPVAWSGAVDVVIVPGLAFTAGGERLGYGGGYYDRWLAAHPATAAIAVTFEAQILSALPSTPTDVTLSRVLSERRSIRRTGPGLSP